MCHPPACIIRHYYFVSFRAWIYEYQIWESVTSICKCNEVMEFFFITTVTISLSSFLGLWLLAIVICITRTLFKNPPPPLPSPLQVFVAQLLYCVIENFDASWNLPYPWSLIISLSTNNLKVLCLDQYQYPKNTDFLFKSVWNGSSIFLWRHSQKWRHHKFFNVSLF